MHYQNSETVRNADQKPLMSGASGIIRQKPSHSAGSRDLDTRGVRPGSGAESRVDAAGISVDAYCSRGCG